MIGTGPLKVLTDCHVRIYIFRGIQEAIDKFFFTTLRAEVNARCRPCVQGNVRNQNMDVSIP